MTAREIADAYWSQAPRSNVRRRTREGQVSMVTRMELAEGLARRFGVSVDEFHRVLAADLAADSGPERGSDAQIP